MNRPLLVELFIYVLLWLAVISVLWCYKRYQEWRYGEEADKVDTQRRLDEALARVNRYYERWLATRKGRGPNRRP